MKSSVESEAQSSKWRQPCARKQHSMAQYPAQSSTLWWTVGGGRQSHEDAAQEEHQASPPTL